MPEERVTLLYTQDLRADVPTLAPVLSATLGVTMVDARRMARYGRGLFLENLDPARAQQLIPVLKNMGIECISVPTASILRPPKPVRCVLADPTGATFAYKISFQKEFEHVPWDAIRFISVGVVATQQFRDAMAGSVASVLPTIYKVEDPEAKAELRDAIARRGIRKIEEARESVHANVPDLPMPLLDQMKDAISGAIKPAAAHLPPTTQRREAEERVQDKKELTELQRKTREKILKDELDTLYREQTDSYIDLITIGMSGRYRISRRDFRFDYLRGHAKPTSLENFKTLVEDLLFRIPQVLVPPMTDRFRHMTDVREIVFDTLDEFDRYNTWVFHMAELAKQGAPGVGLIGTLVSAAPTTDPPPSGTPAP